MRCARAMRRCVWAAATTTTTNAATRRLAWRCARSPTSCGAASCAPMCACSTRPLRVCPSRRAKHGRVCLALTRSPPPPASRSAWRQPPRASRPLRPSRPCQRLPYWPSRTHSILTAATSMSTTLTPTTRTKRGTARATETRLTRATTTTATTPTARRTRPITMLATKLQRLKPTKKVRRRRKAMLIKMMLPKKSTKSPNNRTKVNLKGRRRRQVKTKLIKPRRKSSLACWRMKMMHWMIKHQAKMRTSN